MAYKMKGAPMIANTKSHGTNANYKKSGAPFFGGIGNVLTGGVSGLAKSLFGRKKNRNCPKPAEVGAPGPNTPAGANPANPNTVAPPPAAAAPAPAPAPAAAAPVEEEVPAAPMKRSAMAKKKKK